MLKMGCCLLSVLEPGTLGRPPPALKSSSWSPTTSGSFIHFPRAQYKYYHPLHGLWPETGWSTIPQSRNGTEWKSVGPGGKYTWFTSGLVTYFRSHLRPGAHTRNSFLLDSPKADESVSDLPLKSTPSFLALTASILG